MIEYIASREQYSYRRIVEEEEYLLVFKTPSTNMSEKNESKHDRLPPPVWDPDTKSYDDWRFQVELWMKACIKAKLKGADCGYRLYDKLKDIRSKGVGDKVTVGVRTGEVDVFDEDSVQQLIELLDKSFKKDDLSMLHQSWTQFIQYRKTSSDSVDDFLNKFALKAAALKRDGVKLPEDVLGLQLIDAANLEEHEAQLVLTAVDYDRRDRLYEQAEKALRKFLSKKLVLDSNSNSSNSINGNSSDDNKALLTGKFRHQQPFEKRVKTCFKCHSPDHIIRFCPLSKSKQSDRMKGEKANVTKGKGENHDESSSDGERGLVIINHAILSTTKNIDPENSWIIDSGATSHMCMDKKWYAGELKQLKEPELIKVGDGSFIECNSVGDIELDMKIGDNFRNCKLHDVLFVPDLSYNLISVAKAMSRKCIIEFNDKKCTIRNKQLEVIAVGKEIGKLWFLECADSRSNQCEVMNTATEVLNNNELWHSRFGHLGHDNLRKLVDENMVEGCDYKCHQSSEGVCEPCINGKHHRQKFPKFGGRRASDLLDLVHTDVSGRMDTESLSGKEYFVSFIDDKSRHVWTYGIKKKSDVFDIFIEWKARAERTTERKLKTLRSDNGGEYISEEFELYLKKDGVAHQRTISKTPEQNGVAERMNRTLVEMVRSMLSESNLPKKFWAEALATATYLRNRCPTKAVDGKTPYEVWSGEKPNVQHLRIFGSICHSHIPKDERRKLDMKSKEAIFLGYGLDTKGYRLYDYNKKRVYFSRDVKFDEGKFYHKGNRLMDVSESSKESRVDDNEEKELKLVGDEESIDHIRRSSRIKKSTEFYGERVHIANEYDEPKTLKEALSGMNSEKWAEAMENEINSLSQNGVWELKELPDGRKPIGCKWIYKTKLDENGHITRYKARLVAQGFTQRYGVDYDETFSPVVRFESIRTVIAIAAWYGIELHQMDVKTAFLNGELKEEIYMQQPEGFKVEGKENLVCELKRSIYGLKQSARCWNAELDNRLKKMKFMQCTSDPCIYIRIEDGEVFLIAVYVDDIIIGGKDDSIVDEVKKAISEEFDVTDMGLLHHFLGIKVVQCCESKRTWIGQPNYTKDLLLRLHMDEANPVETPMEVNLKLMKRSPEEEVFDRKLYQSVVGSLLYLSTKTRPDIAYAVSNVARFSSDPSKTHWSYIKRILRYLKGTVNFGLCYSYNDLAEKELIGFSDADWAGDVTDRKSTSGYVFMLSGSAISWRSKKQPTVALSTAEAEYMALASATQEAVWLRHLLAFIYHDTNVLSTPTRIYEDNQSSICMAKNHQFHGRAKHIDIKFHFVREQVSCGSIDLKYCKSNDMVADIFTKSLCVKQFKYLRTLLGMSIEEDC